jgi:RimJ/RimL family protein N-acetyltransferase
MIKLVPLDQNNPDHVGWLFKVRTHPEVAARFFAPPPKKFVDHVQFLTKVLETKEREFFIVYADDQMTGYCQIINRSDNLEVGFALHPDWQGKGIGSASVQLLLDHIRQSGSDKSSHITLIVKKDNQRAINLYQKFGFVITAELDNELSMKLNSCILH